MASSGAKVMQPASIQEARLNRMIDVRSTFQKNWNYNNKEKISLVKIQ